MSLNLENPRSVYYVDADETTDPDRLAERIKRVYVEMRTAQIGKEYCMQDRYRKDENIWLRAAKMLIRKKVSPLAAMRALFTYNMVSGGPYPTQVGSTYLERDIDLYQATYRDPKNEWLLAYRDGQMYLQQFAANSQNKLTTTEMLVSPLVDNVIHPFICCCLLPVPKVLAKHGAAAKRLVEETPGLVDQMQSENIPMNWLNYVR